MHRRWILGASDPEMKAIEGLLRECGQTVVYAEPEFRPAFRAGPLRVPPNMAYSFGVPEVEPGDVLVECAPVGGVPDGVVVVDHHRPGDPGWGRPPAEFLAASSIGQVVAMLAREGMLPAWPRNLRADEPSGTIRHLRYLGWYVSSRDGWVQIPSYVILAAAGDHCPAAAYRGECPGVEPDALMRWRAETRAAFQKRPVEAVLEDVERARGTLRAAPRVDLGGELVADLRAAGVVPELPEAGLREGQAYVAVLRVLDGWEQLVLGASSGSACVVFRAWAESLGEGWREFYGGDPARGFAGAWRSA